MKFKKSAFSMKHRVHLQKTFISLKKINGSKKILLLKL